MRNSKFKYKTQDLWIGRWKVKILESALSRDNKEVLIEFLSWKTRNDRIARGMPIITKVLSSLPEINLKKLTKEDMNRILDSLSKTQWLYSTTSLITIKQYLREFLVFIELRYKRYGLDARENTIKYFRDLRKKEILAVSEASNGNTAAN
jgi:hypothetical protein